MNKRCAFYTFFWLRSLREVLWHQGCTKSCIFYKSDSVRTLTPRRVLFWVVFRKEWLC